VVVWQISWGLKTSLILAPQKLGCTYIVVVCFLFVCSVCGCFSFVIVGEFWGEDSPPRLSYWHAELEGWPLASLGRGDVVPVELPDQQLPQRTG